MIDDRSYAAMPAPEARLLAAELIAELTDQAGDTDAVNATLRDWLDREDVHRLSYVAMAAVQLVFAKCLTRVPIDQAPPGALTLQVEGTSTTR